MSTSVRKEYANFKDCKFNKVAIFNGIILILVACSSLPCTLSLYNVFMSTISVKAGQKRTEARRTKEWTNTHTKKGRKERTHHVDFLNLLVDACHQLFWLNWSSHYISGFSGCHETKSSEFTMSYFSGRITKLWSDPWLPCCYLVIQIIGSLHEFYCSSNECLRDIDKGKCLYTSNRALCLKLIINYVFATQMYSHLPMFYVYFNRIRIMFI